MKITAKVDATLCTSTHYSFYKPISGRWSCIGRLQERCCLIAGYVTTFWKISYCVCRLIKTLIFSFAHGRKTLKITKRLSFLLSWFMTPCIILKTMRKSILWLRYLFFTLLMLSVPRWGKDTLHIFAMIITCLPMLDSQDLEHCLGQLRLNCTQPQGRTLGNEIGRESEEGSWMVTRRILKRIFNTVLLKYSSHCYDDHFSNSRRKMRNVLSSSTLPIYGKVAMDN